MCMYTYVEITRRWTSTLKVHRKSILFLILLCTYLKLSSHTLYSLQCTLFASVMSFELGGLKYEDLQTHLKPV